LAEDHHALHAELWAVTAELDQLPHAPASAHRAAELAACFDALRAASAAGDAGERERAERAIWAIWCDHADPAAKARMVLGIRRLAEDRLPDGCRIFDRLVAETPDWAEAWNKRATVRFLLGRDAASVADIRRTLALEPRHFGALGGLAQIALRNGNPDAARAALEHLLRVNPGAPGVADLIDTIDRDAPRSVH
jgi:tetratricopeptide (TPR) repeat protein